MQTFHNGIHHISVLAGDAQQNANFYVRTLGMRLVKKSVNQDDPGTYHLFYANQNGSPGSGLTFFPWPNARQGKPGVGEAVKVALSVPEDSVLYWAEHLAENDIDFDGPYERFGKQSISFKDPDGLWLELVFDRDSEGYPAWNKGGVPSEKGIRGFTGTTLRLRETNSTARILEDVFHFEQKEHQGKLIHFKTGSPIGSSVILEESEAMPSVNGRGIVHHVAFRSSDMEDLATKREKVLEMGLHPTDFIDRHWFHSVYFHTPGGVLFEIATDGPGYDVDEDPDKLGQKLILPPWLEPRRKDIESVLPVIKV